jgi:hypothetical protein
MEIPIYLIFLIISVILIGVGSLLIGLDSDKYGVTGVIIILIFFFTAGVSLIMHNKMY